MAYADVPAYFTFEGSDLVFGRTSEQQWILPMSPGGGSIGVTPVSYAMTGRVEAEGFYLDVYEVLVVPWACQTADDGNAGTGAGRSVYGPISRSRVSVVVKGTVGSSIDHRGGTTAGRILLRTPGGNQVATSTLFGVYDIGNSTNDVPVCFPVDSPAAGPYTLVWTSTFGGEATLDFTVS